jgi:hypothetical protein
MTLVGGAGFAGRLALSRAFQQEPSSPAFQRAVACTADFVCDFAREPGGALDPALRSRVVSAFAKACEHTRIGLGFSDVADAFDAPGPAGPAGRALAALRELGAAEEEASLFGAPVAVATLLAPSPVGRRAAVLLDLAGVEAEAAERMEALALLTLLASAPEVAEALDGGPLLVLGNAPQGALHAFACVALAAAASRAPMSLVLVDGATDGSLPESFPKLVQEGQGLRFAPPGTLLPLPPVPADPRPLSAEEVRVLSPGPLRTRLLGREFEEEGAPADPFTATSTEKTKESVGAFLAASGDLEALARKRARSAQKEAAPRKANYEAGDFELK